MSTRVAVWLAVVSTYAFIAFIAGLFGPLNWLIAPYCGFMFCKWSGWRLVWTMSLSLLLGGLLGWLMTGYYIFPVYQLLVGSTFTVLLFLAGALFCQIKHFRAKRQGSAPSNPSSGGNSMFRRLFLKRKQEDRNTNRLQASVIPTA